MLWDESVHEPVRIDDPDADYGNVVQCGVLEGALV